jgi:hypothetical protein
MDHLGAGSPPYCLPTVRSTTLPGWRCLSAATRRRARPCLSPPRASNNHSGASESRSVKVGSAPIQIATPARVTSASCARHSASRRGSVGRTSRPA